MKSLSFLPQLTPELELVARLARLEPSPADHERVRSLVTGGVSWDNVLSLAMDHRVVPLAYRNLARLGCEGVPLPAMQEFGRMKDVAVRKNLIRFADFLAVSGGFQRGGIQAVAAKGFPLAQMVYGDIGLRQGGDLDYFVEASDVERAVEVLQNLGYRPNLEETFHRVGLRRVIRSKPEWSFSNTRGTYVDLQWRVGWQAGLIGMPLQDITRKPGKVRFGSQEVLEVAPDVLLPLLLLHGQAHCWERLRWLVDVAEFMEHLPPQEGEETHHRIREVGAEQSLLSALWLMDRFWERPTSEAFGRYSSTNLLSHRMKTDLWACFQGSGLDLDAGWNWFRVRTNQIRLRRHFGKSLLEWLGAVFRPSTTDWTSFRLPRWLYFLYVPLRILRVAFKAVKLLLAQGGIGRRKA